MVPEESAIASAPPPDDDDEYVDPAVPTQAEVMAWRAHRLSAHEERWWRHVNG